MPRRTASPRRRATTDRAERSAGSARSARGPAAAVDPVDPVAEPLHRGALRLLRLLRREDATTGVGAARLSALSVLVFGGPCSLGALAAAEQVSAPTMSRLVAELEREGWLKRRADPADARATRLEATAAAKRLLDRGRASRLSALSGALRTLSAADRAALAAATAPLDRLVRALAVNEGPAVARTSRRRFD